MQSQKPKLSTLQAALPVPPAPSSPKPSLPDIDLLAAPTTPSLRSSKSPTLQPTPPPPGLSNQSTLALYAAPPAPGSSSSKSPTVQDTPPVPNSFDVYQMVRTQIGLGHGQGSDEALEDADETAPEIVPTTKVEFRDEMEISRPGVFGHDKKYYETSKFKRERKTTKDSNKTFDYSIVLRRKYIQQKDGSLDLKKIVLRIQSSRIQAALKKIVNHTGGVDLDVIPIKINQPFKFLFYNRSQIHAFQGDCPETTREMSLLSKFIRENEVMKTTIREHKRLTALFRINSKLLWTIYRPGELAVFNYHGAQQIYRVDIVKTDDDGGVNVEVVGMGYDGKRVGMGEGCINVSSFKNTADIKSLVAVPLEFFPDCIDFREKLIKRGKYYQELLRSPGHFAYTGPAWEVRNEPPSFEVDGRVITDYKTAIEDEFTYQSRLLPEQKEEVAVVDDTSGLSAGADIDAKSTTEEIPYTIEEVPDQEKRDSLRDQLSNEEYMLFPARIPAFSLRQKKWGHVLVDNLREIEWNDNAFDFLEMDAEKKLLTQGLINGHKNVSASETSTGIVQRFDDIVAGKGRGLIFLLHGPPGLGKTLTAECISEHTRRPLYPISSGELTSDISKLEDKLQSIFDTGRKWGAVVLLDEADVLMSRRSSGTLERNSIVSVCLRLMEYYEGILFLTTNRYEDFDDAIYNRVHVTLRFEPPTPEVRGRIWRKIIQTNYQNTIPGTPHSLDSTLAIDSSSSEPVYRVLGKLEINGRTIKNLLSTAAYFAQSEKRPLGIRDLSLVLNVNLKGDPKNYPKYVKALDELKEVIEGLGGAGGT